MSQTAQKRPARRGPDESVRGAGKALLPHREAHREAFLSPAVQQLVDATRHLSAEIPRQASITPEPKERYDESISSVLQLERTLAHMQTLLTDLQVSAHTLRGTLACIASERRRVGESPSKGKGPLHMTEVALGVIEDSGFSLDDVRSQGRTETLVAMRHGVMRALHAEGYGYAVIGRFLNRNHGSVVYALGKKGRE
jgi:hypothetical protein